MSKGKGSVNYHNTAYYCKLFSDLNVNRNNKRGGAALNQPILLLSVVELIAQGVIKDNIILISDELIDTFKKNWAVLGSEPYKDSDCALPFFHLKNAEGKFWKLQYSSRYEGGRPQTINTLRRDVDFASLDSELFDLLQDQNARQELIDALVATWFSSKGKEIEDILQINQDFQNSTLEEIENLGQSDNEPKVYLKKSLVRNAFFRKAVVHIYDYRCAFCRLKVTMSLNQTIVDGAHIKPLSQFYDNKIDNGISLCKNHHWAFDRGLFSLDNTYRILVSPKLEEDSPKATPMKDFHGETILLPISEKYYPRIEAIQWHRENLFET